MGRRIRPPTADQKAGKWSDVVTEAERASRRSGGLLANLLEKVFVEHAYVLRVDWNADMAEKLLEDLIVTNNASIRTVFAKHVEVWRGHERAAAERLLEAEEPADG